MSEDFNIVDFVTDRTLGTMRSDNAVLNEFFNTSATFAVTIATERTGKAGFFSVVHNAVSDKIGIANLFELSAKFGNV